MRIDIQIQNIQRIELLDLSQKTDLYQLIKLILKEELSQQLIKYYNFYHQQSQFNCTQQDKILLSYNLIITNPYVQSAVTNFNLHQNIKQILKQIGSDHLIKLTFNKNLAKFQQISQQYKQKFLNIKIPQQSSQSQISKNINPFFQQRNQYFQEKNNQQSSQIEDESQSLLNQQKYNQDDQDNQDKSNLQNYENSQLNQSQSNKYIQKQQSEEILDSLIQNEKQNIEEQQQEGKGFDFQQSSQKQQNSQEYNINNNSFISNQKYENSHIKSHQPIRQDQNQIIQMQQYSQKKKQQHNIKQSLINKKENKKQFSKNQSKAIIPPFDETQLKKLRSYHTGQYQFRNNNSLKIIQQQKKQTIQQQKEISKRIQKQQQQSLQQQGSIISDSQINQNAVNNFYLQDFQQKKEIYKLPFQFIIHYQLTSFYQYSIILNKDCQNQTFSEIVSQLKQQIQQKPKQNSEQLQQALYIDFQRAKFVYYINKQQEVIFTQQMKLSLLINYFQKKSQIYHLQLTFPSKKSSITLNVFQYQEQEKRSSKNSKISTKQFKVDFQIQSTISTEITNFLLSNFSQFNYPIKSYHLKCRGKEISPNQIIRKIYKKFTAIPGSLVFELKIIKRKDQNKKVSIQNFNLINIQILVRDGDFHISKKLKVSNLTTLNDNLLNIATLFEDRCQRWKENEQIKIYNLNSSLQPQISLKQMSIPLKQLFGKKVYQAKIRVVRKNDHKK